MWEVQDRYTSEHFALKVLAEDATEHEMAALVRETVALSGLEGIGLPQVMRFGRLPHSGRPYLIRELVRGSSLEQLLASTTRTKLILNALARAADQLTLIHRAGFFHGDVKPANIIVADSGEVTLVDLGLAAPWRDSGVMARGLTPKYAAPELLQLTATFGVVLIVRDAALAAFGAQDLLGPRVPGLAGSIDLLGRAVPQYDFVVIDTPSGPLGISVSIGLTSSDSQKFSSSMELFIRADKMLYRAKELGRDRIVSDGTPEAGD